MIPLPWEGRRKAPGEDFRSWRILNPHPALSQRERVFSLPSRQFLPDWRSFRPITALIHQHSQAEAELLNNRNLTRRDRAVRKGSSSQFVYSRPTMCLHCHLIVEMVHERDADPQKGSWQCPQCGHMYPFQHWKIRKQSPKKEAA
jgi:hypothetical protein